MVAGRDSETRDVVVQDTAWSVKLHCNAREKEKSGEGERETHDQMRVLRL